MHFITAQVKMFTLVYFEQGRHHNIEDLVLDAICCLCQQMSAQ